MLLTFFAIKVLINLNRRFSRRNIVNLTAVTTLFSFIILIETYLHVSRRLTSSSECSCYVSQLQAKLTNGLANGYTQKKRRDASKHVCFN